MFNGKLDRFFLLRYSTDLEEKANAWPTEFDASLSNSTVNLNLGDYSCGADHCLESYKNVTKGMILFLEFMSEPVTISESPKEFTNFRLHHRC